MAVTADEKLEPFLENHFFDHTMPEMWGCMDRRQLYIPGQYYKVAGGAAGFGDDVLVANEMNHNGWFASLGMSRHEFSAEVSNTLIESGILLFNHVDCAAIKNGPAISESEAAADDTVFRVIKEMQPEIEADQFTEVVHTKKELLGTLPVASAETVYRDMSEKNIAHHSVPTAEVEPLERSAVAFAAIWRPFTIFNSQKAIEAGQPMYAANMGESLEKLVFHLRDYLDVNWDDVQLANSVRTGTIMARHILNPDGQPFDILRTE